jgi:hypothetical protein
MNDTQELTYSEAAGFIKEAYKEFPESTSLMLTAYSQNPRYRQLSYHNVTHVKAALVLFDAFNKYDRPEDSSGINFAQLGLMFHDINHTGHPDGVPDKSGRHNIAYALETVDVWIRDNDDRARAIKEYVKATEWPHSYEVDESVHGVSGALARLVQDADVLSALIPKAAGQLMLGIYREKRAFDSKVPKLTGKELLAKQIEFMTSYEPHSKVGLLFKNALFPKAQAEWKKAAKTLGA